MNAPILPEVLARRDGGPQADLPFASEGVLRYVWESRFGAILIEVMGDRVYVNGQPVKPADAEIESVARTRLPPW